jgi:ATPase subunit of ABC transporter with duplicated ATPase domains
MQPAGTLAARNVTRLHGAVPVLEGASVVVPPRARIGVVGPNGIGKSTLLRVLAGLEAPDEGVVERTPTALTVGYLPQEPDVRPGETLRAFLARRTGVAAAEREMDALAARLEREPQLAVRYTDALDRFLALGGDDLEARARGVCAQVGLAAERLAQPTGSLSGGQAARAALAAILLSRFDVLLLDEPTNDLDFAGLELLERFLTETSAALVVVSHDRALLDKTVTRVVELAPAVSGTREYAGGYAEYERERERARRAEYEAWGEYVAERERIEEQYRRRREWIDRAQSRRRKKKTRDVAGNFERRLGRLERADKPWEPWQLHVSLAAARRSADVVARLEGAIVERGLFRLGPVDLELRRGDRLAVVGPNGSGKSTLLATLLGRLPLAAGNRRLGSGVVAGELEQGRESFTTALPLLDAFLAVTRQRPEEARTLLAKFDLGSEDVVRAAGSLSPGERTRAALAALMARGVNLLVLDEPTNHLDLPAIEQLEEALAGFDGTAVVVSHDRRFLERVAPTATFDLSAASVRAEDPAAVGLERESTARAGR